MHFHGYRWTGPADQLKREGEGERRPSGASFATNPYPPMILWHWLRKTPAHVKGTFTDVEAAGDWLEAQYGEIAARITGSTAQCRTAADYRKSASESLAQGREFCWGLYLAGTYYDHTALIACPPRIAEDRVACPAPPRR
ncbi:hypothetical protein [Sinosporangium siamense]|uniref:Uncharacterized protein n=1 Tax=Sinosporangium siamense TaxID=1367973 RepID=A0A919VA09_9ACTN|nr:hypothetical protein [Sinosporangium siamense]GII90634.1 hypothetical protein Ssi02_08650 [Sinosporangium siamense]